MTGWIGDCLRFYWALFYWNSRKTWFRLRGAQRDDCPCQTYGDSGQAFDSRCEAVTHWHRPERFRKVCPLLVETPQGWRCSVNAESVRPFWGRAVVHGLLLIVGLYLAATVAVFAALRLAHYETSYLMVAWPPRWSELRLAQEKLYANRAQQALRNGNYAEAILSLEMVTQLNPRNYPAGLALAGLNQLAGQPTVADHIYERLLRDAPDQRRQTAQIWFRNLLARAAYPEMKGLAVLMLNEDPAERAAWLNTLLFACRQTADAGYLGMVLAENPNLADWCTELIGTEQMLLQNQIDRALPRLTRVPRSGANGYIPYYQVDRLLRHGDPSRAADMLRACEGLLPPDDAVIRQNSLGAESTNHNAADPEARQQDADHQSKHAEEQVRLRVDRGEPDEHHRGAVNEAGDGKIERRLSQDDLFPRRYWLAFRHPAIRSSDYDPGHLSDSVYFGAGTRSRIDCRTCSVASLSPLPR